MPEGQGIKTPRIAYLNGAPTDNNATLFRDGYDSILQPRYDDGTYLKGPEQPVPRWNNDEGRFIFDQMTADTAGAFAKHCRRNGID